MSHIKEMHVVL